VTPTVAAALFIGSGNRKWKEGFNPFQNNHSQIFKTISKPFTYIGTMFLAGVSTSNTCRTWRDIIESASKPFFFEGDQ
jgi:hypothetical protein